MTEIRKCECKNVINGGRVCGFEYISYGSNKVCPACKSIEHNGENPLSGQYTISTKLTVFV